MIQQNRRCWRLPHFPSPSLTLTWMRRRLERVRFSYKPGRPRIAMVWMDFGDLCIRPGFNKHYHWSGRLPMRSTFKCGRRRF